MVTPITVSSESVTPLAGVWIEIPMNNQYLKDSLVTPLAGVWIEMEALNSYMQTI